MKVEKECIIAVNWHDLEDEIKAAWGHEWSFLADQESGNDITHEFIVTNEIWDYEEKDLQEFKRTGKQTLWRASVLLNALCREGRIEAGNYLVRVSW